jgi:hypothetical protein
MLPTLEMTNHQSSDRYSSSQAILLREELSLSDNSVSRPCWYSFFEDAHFGPRYSWRFLLIYLSSCWLSLISIPTASHCESQWAWYKPWRILDYPDYEAPSWCTRTCVTKPPALVSDLVAEDYTTEHRSGRRHQKPQCLIRPAA